MTDTKVVSQDSEPSCVTRRTSCSVVAGRAVWIASYTSVNTCVKEPSDARAVAVYVSVDVRTCVTRRSDSAGGTSGWTFLTGGIGLEEANRTNALTVEGIECGTCNAAGAKGGLGSRTGGTKFGLAREALEPEVFVEVVALGALAGCC